MPSDLGKPLYDFVIDARDELCDQLRIYPTPADAYDACRLFVDAYENYLKAREE